MHSYTKTLNCEISVEVFVAALERKLVAATAEYEAAVQRYEQSFATANPRVAEATEALQRLLEMANNYWAKNLTGKLIGNVRPPEDRIAGNLTIHMHRKNWDPISRAIQHELFDIRRSEDTVTVFVDRARAQNSTLRPSNNLINHYQIAIKSFSPSLASKVRTTVKEAEELEIAPTDYLDTWYE